MSWHAVDFHFSLQIAPLHNKNTSHIRQNMLRGWGWGGWGEMEMFILAHFDLKESREQNCRHKRLPETKGSTSGWGGGVSCSRWSTKAWALFRRQVGGMAAWCMARPGEWCHKFFSRRLNQAAKSQAGPNCFMCYPPPNNPNLGKAFNG